MHKIFTTNYYKVLEMMYDNMITVGHKKFCPLSQSDIASELRLSRMAINKIFAELKALGYISMVTRGKWQLSSKATLLIETTRRI